MRSLKSDPVTCQSIFKLPACAELKLIAGEKGIHRPVRWVHYIEDFDYVECAKKDELIIVAGLQLQPADVFLDFIRRLQAKRVSGIVIYRSKDDEFPCEKEIIEIGNTDNVCIYSLPHKVLLAEITQNICEAIFQSKLSQKSMESFIYSLIHGEIDAESSALSEAYSLGYVGKQTYYCAVLAFDPFRDDFGIDHIRTETSHIFRQNCIMYNRDILYALQNYEVIFLIPYFEKDSPELINKVVLDTIQKFYDHGLATKAVVGISDPCNELAGFRDAYRSAKNLAMLSYFLNIKTLCCQEAGVYNLLFAIKDKRTIEKVYHEILGDLIKIDKVEKTDLLNTLFAFIEHDLNYQETAESLFIHLNTLRYRLKKIQDSLGIVLRDPQNIYKFTLALNIHKYLAFLQNSGQ